VGANFGPANWDRTNMLTFSHVWGLPIGSNSSHLNHGIIGHILGPWYIDGLFRFLQGTPFTVFADPTVCDCPGNVPTAARALVTPVVGNTIVTAPFQGVGTQFTSPTPNTLGVIGRNSQRGPNITNYDLSVLRQFVVHEQIRVELRGEAYNIFNSAQFANPIGNVNSEAFGQSVFTQTFAPNRTLQVAGRILF
jgi:hypothetical protein